MGSDPLYPRHGRRPATAKSPQARLGSVDARHRLQPNVDVIISFFVRIPQGGGVFFDFSICPARRCPVSRFCARGGHFVRPYAKSPTRGNVAGLWGEARLWPSDGALERVPSVELRPERTAAPLYVFLRPAADSLHLARDFDDDLERLRKAVNGLRQLGEIDLQR